jgi:hypothetical protein
MQLCQAIAQDGSNCTNRSSIVTEEGLNVCKSHKTFTKAKGERLLEFAKEHQDTLEYREYITSFNEEIMEGHEYDVPLKNKYGLIVDFAFVDPEDFKNVMKYSWSKNHNGYSCKGTSHDIPSLMHHFILGKPEEGYVIDHKDNNRLNNRRSNLRFVTQAQNMQNRTTNKNNTTSKYIGVYRHKNKWHAKYSQKYLGPYENEIDAAKRYDTYVLLKHGPESKTNGFVKSYEISITLSDFENDKGIRELPENIQIQYGRYKVFKKYNGKKFYGSSESLEEAKKILDGFNNQITIMKVQEDSDHLSKEIKRNADGHAIINIYDINSNKIDDVIVDDDKWHELSLYTWAKTGNYYQTDVNYKKITMHRYLMNAITGDVVDHINGNKCDHRIQNLRVTNMSVNNHNRKGIGVSSYKGVSYKKSDDKWSANINKDKITYGIGVYDLEIQAAIAVNIKAKQLYGDEAYLNDISEEDISKHLSLVKGKMQSLSELQERKKQSKKNYRGVRQVTEVSWTARIKHNRKEIHIGTYDTEKKAATAYNEKSKELFGDKARLNVIT